MVSESFKDLAEVMVKVTTHVIDIYERILNLFKVWKKMEPNNRNIEDFTEYLVKTEDEINYEITKWRRFRQGLREKMIEE